MMANLTANEVVLLAAAISAVTSILTTLGAVKFGPNYNAQILELTKKIAQLTAAHENLTAIASESATRERMRTSWSPQTRIESTFSETTFSIKADREFTVNRISLLDASGATVG